MPGVRNNERPVRLDDIDVAILEQLQTSSKLTNAALAKRVGISPPSTLERVRKLEARGIVRGYVALIDHEAVNKDIMAIVQVSLADHEQETLARAKVALGQLEEVMECWHTAGDEDFVLKVVVTDMAEYERFVGERLSAVGGIGKIRTAFVLRAVKQSTQVPLDAVSGGARAAKNSYRNGSDQHR